MNGCDYAIVNARGDVVERSPRLPRSVAIRSCAKPFQMLPVCLLGLEDRYRLTSRELTILSSSQLAQSNQVEVLQSLLEKTQIRLTDLHLPMSAPTGRQAYRNWRRLHQRKSTLYHPCIGNHIAMFLIERALTGDGADYLNPDCEAQRMIGRLVYEFAATDDIAVSVDGCGAPCYRMSLPSLATLYCGLTEGRAQTVYRRYEKPICRLRNAFRATPVYLEGDGCLSTILTDCDGIVGKAGADGTLAIGIDGATLGIAISSPERDWASVARTAQSILLALRCGNEQLQRRLATVE